MVSQVGTVPNHPELSENAVLMRRALYGDTNLDGVVDFTDLLALARSYNKPGTWVHGDANYDGFVGFFDLLAQARNRNNGESERYGALLTEADAAAYVATILSTVPEPTTVATMFGFLLVLNRRRRR